jgi:hypothetical protein
MELDFEFVPTPVVENLGSVSVLIIATNKLYSMIP